MGLFEHDVCCECLPDEMVRSKVCSCEEAAQLGFWRRFLPTPTKFACFRGVVPCAVSVNNEEILTHPSHPPHQHLYLTLTFSLLLPAPTTMSDKPVVLLTGASRGLGLAILRLLLSGSSSASAAFPACRVATISRTLTPELSALQASNPCDLVCIQGDVTSASVNAAAVSTALSKFGALDSVVFNAGVVSTQRIATLSPTSFAETLNINTVSLVTTLGAALPALRKSGRATAVLVSSGAATGNTAGWAAYNASKAALNAIARTLANEEEGLAVFAVRPGVVDTDMQTLLRDSGKEAMKEAEMERFLALHREGKLLRPEQPAFTIAALAAKASRVEPKGEGGKGLGEQGAFVTWNDAVLEGFKSE